MLNDGKEFYLPEGFSLDFGLRFRTELHNYGYIFRIIANDTVCFDLVSNYSDGRKSLSFIEGNRIFAPFSNQILEQYEKNSWVTVHFGIDPKTKEITISFNGEEIKIPYHYKNCLDTVFNSDIAVIPTFFPTMFLLWQSEIFASKIKKVK